MSFVIWKDFFYIGFMYCIKKRFWVDFYKNKGVIS